MSNTRFFGGAKEAGITGVLLILSVVANYALLGRNATLRRTIDALKEENRLAEGKTLELVEMHRPDGGVEAVHFKNPGKPTIVYIYSPACGWCKRNYANVKALAGATVRGYRFIAISADPDGVAQFIKEQKPPFELYYGPLGVPGSILKYGGTPQTAVLDTSGKVLKYWQGAYKQTTQRNIEQFFNIRLPGLSGA